MEGLWGKISAALLALQKVLVGLGAPGLFAVALLDAALVPVPGGPDAVLLALSYHTPALMPLYVAAAVVGSGIGSLFLYWVGRSGGEAALRKFSAEKRARVERVLERYELLALILAALMPPPFPFKLFVLSAGVFRMVLWRFVTALLVGRGIRFALEGLAAVRYGDQAAALFKEHYPKIGLGIAAAVVAVFVLTGLLKRRGPAID
jgi:membrane protein YqaA with SNARE-associated domain